MSLSAFAFRFLRWASYGRFRRKEHDEDLEGCFWSMIAFWFFGHSRAAQGIAWQEPHQNQSDCVRSRWISLLQYVQSTSIAEYSPYSIFRTEPVHIPEENSSPDWGEGMLIDPISKSQIHA